jgi:hypothetical protein
MGYEIATQAERPLAMTGEVYNEISNMTEMTYRCGHG